MVCLYCSKAPSTLRKHPIWNQVQTFQKLAPQTMASALQTQIPSERFRLGGVFLRVSAIVILSSTSARCVRLLWVTGVWCARHTRWPSLLQNPFHVFTKTALRQMTTAPSECRILIATRGSPVILQKRAQYFRTLLRKLYDVMFWHDSVWEETSLYL